MRILLLLLFACSLASGQEVLRISTDKTTTLIFPFAVRHADRGLGDILVQPVKENEKILLVKAARADFPESNLSVVTEDGSVYSFLVRYEARPAQWVYQLPVLRESPVSGYAKGLLNNPFRLRGIRDRKWDMRMELTGVYIRGAVLYCQLLLCNESSIDYDISLLKFYIRDKTGGRRRAVQERELSPLFIAGNTKKVRAFSHNRIVVALDKFTIPDAQYFALQVTEQNGGRQLMLRVGNRQLLKAVPLGEIE